MVGWRGSLAGPLGSVRPLLTVLPFRQQAGPAGPVLLCPGNRVSPGRAGKRTLSSKVEGFRGLRLRLGPCRACPPSYMRLTVAISRAFDRWGVGLVRRQGPANLPQKEGYEDHGKGHWDRSRHHEFVCRRNGWQDSESHRKRRGHADDPVDRRL